MSLSYTTQVGNASRFVSRYGARVRYCHPWKKWLVWDDRQWRPDDKGQIYGLGTDTVLSIKDEATNIKDDLIRDNFGEARSQESEPS